MRGARLTHLDPNLSRVAVPSTLARIPLCFDRVTCYGIAGAFLMHLLRYSPVKGCLEVLEMGESLGGTRFFAFIILLSQHPNLQARFYFDQITIEATIISE
jgi:hypothetical protein